MTNAKMTTGQTGEQVAANFLQSKGYAILDMNFQNDSGRRLGEIDIVAQDLVQDEIVFVEVKTREFRQYQNTLPEENIRYPKLRKLDKIATVYLRQHKMTAHAYRFDAISVWLNFETRMARIKHIPSL